MKRKCYEMGFCHILIFCSGSRCSSLVVSACTDSGDSNKENLDKILLQHVFPLWLMATWLQAMLRKAAKALQQNKEFTAEQAHNYHMSVTEREVM